MKPYWKVIIIVINPLKEFNFYVETKGHFGIWKKQNGCGIVSQY